MTQQYVSVSVMVKAMYRPVAPGEPQLCPDRAAAEGLGLRDDIAAKAGRKRALIRSGVNPAPSAKSAQGSAAPPSVSAALNTPSGRSAARSGWTKK